MQRQKFIERVLRQTYGEFWSDDAQITENLVNTWLEPAIAVAAKANYADNLKLEGIAFVNGGFYTTFKGIEVEVDDSNYLYRAELPHIPFGIGNDEGVSTIQLKDTESKQLSQPFIWMTQNQKAFYKNMRPIPNKILCYSESKYIYMISTIILNSYTATVTMISGGLDTNMQSELNVPADYFPIMFQYLQQQLTLQRNAPKDEVNDGVDVKSTI
jgi:hypothetical protein